MGFVGFPSGELPDVFERLPPVLLRPGRHQDDVMRRDQLNEPLAIQLGGDLKIERAELLGAVRDQRVIEVEEDDPSH